jgi:hypothetical protein
MEARSKKYGSWWSRVLAEVNAYLSAKLTQAVARINTLWSPRLASMVSRDLQLLDVLNAAEGTFTKAAAYQVNNIEQKQWMEFHRNLRLIRENSRRHAKLVGVLGKKWRDFHSHTYQQGFEKSGDTEGDMGFAAARRGKRKDAAPSGWKASGFFSQGKQDIRFFHLVQSKDSGLRAASYHADTTIQKFNALVKQHNPDADTLRTALGTTDNKLTDQQYADYLKLRKTDKARAEQERLDDIRRNALDAKERSKAALKTLPQDLADVVAKMRDDIDTLSKTLLRNGMISRKLQITVGDNLGVYLSRGYEIFDNSEWASYITTSDDPEAVAVRNRAWSYMRDQVVATKAAAILRQAKWDEKVFGTVPPTKAEALTMADALSPKVMCRTSSTPTSPWPMIRQASRYWEETVRAKRTSRS